MKKLLLLWLLSLGLCLAQSGRLDFVGPGSVQLSEGRLSGQLTQWDREATPKLVLAAPASPVRVFAEIDAEGNFVLDLPAVDSIPLGTKTCTGSEAAVGVFSDIMLLTPLDGFTTPTEANQGLSVIGSVYIVDAAFSQAVAQPNTRMVQIIASPVDQSIAVGACNNQNGFELKAGWNLVTLTLGQSGGPHEYNPGMAEGTGLYWSAFLESPATPVEASRSLPAALEGSWSAIQGDTRIHMNLAASGAGQIEAIEGERKQALEGQWHIRTDAVFPDGLFILAADGGEIAYLYEPVDNNSFVFFADRARLAEQALYFSRQGIATQHPLIEGLWQNPETNQLYHFAADGSFEQDGQQGQWFTQDNQLTLRATDQDRVFDLQALSATVMRLQDSSGTIDILIRIE